MLKKSLYIACTATLLSASTTMCYKKDHIDPSTIDTVVLDGGECNGKLSVKDMKKKGYIVDSMKLQNGTNGLNYIYIFKKEFQNKKEVVTKSTISDAQLTAQLEKIAKAKELKKEKEAVVSSFEDGKKSYNRLCRSCHGDGTISAYNTARPLKELSLDDMKEAIRDYTNGTKDNGMAIIMAPNASLVTQKDIENIYKYLKTL